MISIIFYPRGYFKAINSFEETALAISQAMNNKTEEHIFIHTSQMCFLTDAWGFDLDVWIVNADDLPVQIVNQMYGVDKELRKEHNLFRLWRTGALRNDLI